MIKIKQRIPTPLEEVKAKEEEEEHMAATTAAVLTQQAVSVPEPASTSIPEVDEQQQAAAAPVAAATETTIDAAAAAAAAVASDDFDASSEAVNSTLMGIALLAYLQTNAKREADDDRHASGSASGSAPSTSATRAPLERTPSDRVPRRYQRMSPKDEDAPGEPLARTLAAIKTSQSAPQYVCKR